MALNHTTFPTFCQHNILTVISSLYRSILDLFYLNANGKSPGMNLIPKSVLENIRKLDAYPKTLEDFRIKTYGGALVTLFSILIALTLFISEVNYYLTPEIDEELLVDVSRGDKLSIYFDVTFPRLPCSLISIDAIDVSGDQHIDIKHNIYRVKLNENGEPIEKPKRDVSIGSKKEEFLSGIKAGSIGSKKEEFLSGIKAGSSGKKKEEFLSGIKAGSSGKPTLDPHRCESCYGAESEDRKCCNTCDEVREAYREKGWALKNVRTVGQCVREGVVEDVLTNNREGCQVYGHVEVARVGGNFHIAPGKSMTQDHRHIHEMSLKDTAYLNVTHTINHLSFGPVIPGKSNILDGSAEISDSPSMMYQYYIKIVATMFMKPDGSSVDTNQFCSHSASKKIVRSRFRTSWRLFHL